MHSSLGKLRRAAPGAGAQTNCDRSHHCLECGSDSCPILSHSHNVCNSYIMTYSTFTRSYFTSFD